MEFNSGFKGLSNSLRSCGRDSIYSKLCSLAGCNDRGVELGSWPAGVTSAASNGADLHGVLPLLRQLVIVRDMRGHTSSVA